MRVLASKDYDQMSRRAAYIVAGQVLLNPRSVLGLPTGSTPQGLYRELVRLFQEGDLDFSEVTAFNLDEYLGLSRTDPQSYAWFMEENLFKFVNVPPERRHIPDGMATDPEGECARYERKIEAAGGIDLQILGLGREGHIGFNEPGVKFEKHTHLIRLTEGTIQANARFFSSPEQVPTRALTMGIKSIMGAKRIILLASGQEKADAVAAAVRGPVSPELPASILQLHPDVTFVVDGAASSKL
ncbi:MAG TPA: glucosamine-6-phosphate deaminase [Synergistaceae bacterium]|nr:glucosamine-6-phosphate deaminase [Synergistaceae bacterium]HQF91181.1 glucosamine-6-phosphate deaminase [Synergistaceae bacterium]HQH78205.1 glucosamine-6-phosphate deaminase [Synergistaceae bacterium]